MKICLAGKNQIAVNSVKYLLEDMNVRKDDLVLCTNRNDSGVDDWQPSLKKKGIELGIKTVSLNELYGHKDLIFISLEYDRIINPKDFITDKLYNIHFSLLPKYKGMYTSVFPLLNGEHQSGVTLHHIDEGIDTGDIIAQLEFKIGINDTCRDLYFKYLHFGFELFKKNISSLLTGDYITKQQSHLDSTYYSKNSLDFKNIAINLNKTSFEMHNQIRAFIFKEYQLPIVKGHIVAKSILTNEKIAKKYFAEENNKLILSGIDGYKIILERDE